jgi:carbon monoxide dehydrogenase subunit G
MAEVIVAVEIDRTPSEVWASLRDISSHVEWMADATEIRFVTDQTEGTGTTFECDTKVGPIRLTDVMTITSWIDEAEMGVRHEGIVTGVGEFRLTDAAGGGTRFTWREDLSFPLWLGGPIGEVVAKPVLTAIWKRNLGRLKVSLEGSSPDDHRPTPS